MKRMMLMAILVVAVLTASAQAISQQEAKQRVRQFLKSNTTAGNSRRAMADVPMNAVTTTLPHLFVFNLEDGGYVIASGDERALPVLGYSATDSFDWDRIPENMRAWLRGYGEAIEALGDVQLTNTTARRAARAKIEPLVKTQWSQNPVYNNLCPKYGGQVAKYQNQSCVTGCTATAMAQIMNYHQWPTTATAQIPSYTYSVSNVQQGVNEEFSADALPAVTFDWNNMRNRYLDDNDKPLAELTDAQTNAVATLMRYCGQSIYMRYSPYISLSNDNYVAEALRQYFNYDNTVRYVNRNGYTIAAWEDMIYDELANNRPVIYGGASDDGGHSFICDGYDTNGLFHINWGWEGYKDNYFALSVLNPMATNVAGVAKPGIGFCMYQDAVIGIQPNKSGSTTTIYPELESTAHFVVQEGADNTNTPGYNLYMTYQFGSVLYSEAEFEIGLFFKEGNTWKRDTEESEKIRLKNGDSEYYTFFYYKTVNPSQVPDGTTYLYPFYRCTSVQGAQWQLLAGDNYCFVYTVKNGQVTITALPSASALKVTKCEIAKGSSGEASTKSNLTLTIENSGTVDYEGNLMLLPVSIGNENPATAEATSKNLKGDDPLPTGWSEEPTTLSAAFLKAGATGEATFAFTPKKEGNYLLMVYEPSGHKDIRVAPFAYTSVTIKSATGISETTVKTAATDGAVYDLQGRCISTPKQGLFIKNGRKYLVK